MTALPATPEISACYAALDPGPDDYRQLAALLADSWATSRPRCVGIGGGQGAGKSTLARFIEQACELRGIRTATVGLDDFYLTRAERLELAERIHPLFETRGPPGTHDIETLKTALHDLHAPGTHTLPTFDKGRDNRGAPRTLQGPFDLVILEGWCIGSGPLDANSLDKPVNALEREEDPDGVWRRYCAAQLAGPYTALFTLLETLVFLEVPNLDAVRRWRLEQESERPPEQRLQARAVQRFVAHYERLTLAMRADLRKRADVVVRLDDTHRIAGLRFATPRA
jgi:D-glycerate 3-kinase